MIRTSLILLCICAAVLAIDDEPKPDPEPSRRIARQTPGGSINPAETYADMFSKWANPATYAEAGKAMADFALTKSGGMHDGPKTRKRRSPQNSSPAPPMPPQPPQSPQPPQPPHPPQQ